jgi:hypothetical protein
VRIRASCLSDKPGGTGGTGRKRGSTGAGVEDRMCGSGEASVSVDSDNNCCRSLQESDLWWVGYRGIESKGVITDGPRSTRGVENEDWTDLRLRSLSLRRRSKTRAPIAMSTAATPAIAPPMIAPVFGRLVGVKLSPIGLAFIVVKTGALQWGSLSSRKQSRDSFERTLELMART